MLLGLRLIGYIFLAILNPLGRLVLAIICIMGGFVFGLSSHPVIYHKAPDGHYTIIYEEITGNTDFQLNHGNTYYTIASRDFTPMPGENTFTNKTITALTYIDETTTVDLTVNGTRLAGTGYAVEEFSIANADGTNLQTFTTAEYRQNPTGFYRNNWLGSMISIGIGLFLILLNLFLAKNGIQPSKKSKLAAQGAAPQVRPWAAPPVPGQFPPPTWQHPPFPPQQNPYNQPPPTYHPYSGPPPERR